MDNCGESRANTGDMPDLLGNDCYHETQNRRRLCLAVRVSYDDLADRTAFAGDERHKFRAYQLSTLGYWPTVALMGDRD